MGEREAVLVKAAKDEADRKEAERARRRAEQELAELEAKHAEDERRHRAQEERRARERREEIARLEKEKSEQIERLKQEEEGRVMMEAAKQARAIHEAEKKKKQELEAAREVEKLAIARAEAAKEAERAASRRRSAEKNASEFARVASVLAILGAVTSALALMWSPLHSRTLKHAIFAVNNLLLCYFIRVKAKIFGSLEDESQVHVLNTVCMPSEEMEATERDADSSTSDKRRTPGKRTSVARRGGRGRSKTPSTKSKPRRRSPSRSKSTSRKTAINENEASASLNGTPVLLRRSGRVNRLDTGNYYVD